MKAPRKADIFAFMLKENNNNNNNLRLLKSAALTALQSASHSPAGTKQPLLLLYHCCLDTDQPGFGHCCSLLRMTPRTPSSPCLCHPQPHFPVPGAAAALASCVPRHRYTGSSWPWIMHGATVWWELKQGDPFSLGLPQALPAKLGSKLQLQHMLSINHGTAEVGREH